MVQILDTTLREGEQTPGVCFSPYVKQAIARKLDGLGVDIIEAGHPVVDVEIRDAVRHIAGCRLRASVGAHCRSLRGDIDAALECGVDFLGIFYCVSGDRLRQVSRKEFSEAVEAVEQAVAYARSQSPGLTIRYTPEDTVRSEWHHIVECSAAAVASGADVISIADTTGYMIPGCKGRDMYEFVCRFKDDLDQRGAHPAIAVHCHNDRGLALANALDGYRAGAEIIDCCVLGLGERAGIVDLASLMTVLHTDYGALADWNLGGLPDLYRFVSAHSGVDIPINWPVAGANAFTHCAGVHTNAALQNPTHYESIDPEIVGRRRNIAIDHMSGRSTIVWALEQIEVDPQPDLVERLLQLAKHEGKKGRAVGLEDLTYMVDYVRSQPVEAHV